MRIAGTYVNILFQNNDEIADGCKQLDKEQHFVTKVRYCVHRWVFKVVTFRNLCRLLLKYGYFLILVYGLYRLDDQVEKKSAPAHSARNQQDRVSNRHF